MAVSGVASHAVTAHGDLDVGEPVVTGGMAEGEPRISVPPIAVVIVIAVVVAIAVPVVVRVQGR
jgi:hypothetical protein